MRQEEWKDVVGYESLYEVSNFGRVRSKDRIVKQAAYNGSTATHIYKGRLLALKKGSNGYYKIDLAVDGKKKEAMVHRLVAQAFIPNPNNLPLVNHKDETRTNNNVDNLEWCTYKHNLTWGSAQLKLSRIRTKHPIIMMDKNGTILNRFNSLREASVASGLSNHQIYYCCTGRNKTSGGYRWKYDTEGKP